jgi:hypothetical protein
LVGFEAGQLALDVVTQVLAKIDDRLAVHAKLTRQGEDSDLFFVFRLLQAKLLRGVPRRLVIAHLAMVSVDFRTATLF